MAQRISVNPPAHRNNNTQGAQCGKALRRTLMTLAVAGVALAAFFALRLGRTIDTPKASEPAAKEESTRRTRALAEVTVEDRTASPSAPADDTPEQQDEQRETKAEETPPTGWITDDDGSRHYYDDKGVMQTGLVTDDTGTTYWIDPESGKLASHEWVEVDGIYYAFDDDGSLVTLGEVVPPSDAENLASMTGRQQAVLDACDITPWPGKALCAGWVSSVFVNAGEPAVAGDACDIARAWCYSDDLAELKPGMIIAVTSHPRTENGRIWGHICIYIGNGLIKDSGTYGIRKSSLGSWLAWFGASETPKWGWANGIDLSAY